MCAFDPPDTFPPKPNQIFLHILWRVDATEAVYVHLKCIFQTDHLQAYNSLLQYGRWLGPQMKKGFFFSKLLTLNHNIMMKNKEISHISPPTMIFFTSGSNGLPTNNNNCYSRSKFVQCYHKYELVQQLKTLRSWVIAHKYVTHKQANQEMEGSQHKMCVQVFKIKAADMEKLWLFKLFSDDNSKRWDKSWRWNTDTGSARTLYFHR